MTHSQTLDVSLTAPLPPGLEEAREVLARLPAEQREVVVLLSYYRLTRDEIGALLGQPLSRVNALFRAAIRSLREILGPPPHHPAFA